MAVFNSKLRLLLLEISVAALAVLHLWEMLICSKQNPFIIIARAADANHKFQLRGKDRESIWFGVKRRRPNFGFIESMVTGSIVMSEMNFT